MMGNRILNKAKYSANNTDEWYTTIETVDEELSHYKDKFNNKIVLCNCDDPFESAFSKYFLRNFNQLHLKKLICTSFVGSQIIGAKERQLCITDENGQELIPQNGYVMMITKMPGVDGEPTTDEEIRKVLTKRGTVKRLKGNGDFASDECVTFLKECDICVTNPPFSLFAELFSLLMEHGKQFLLIGNQNAITYKNIFPYIKEDKVWIGYRFGDMSFKVPQDTEPRKTRFWIDETGQKWRSLGNAMWLTNIDNERRHQTLNLTKEYNEEEYPKYDGTNVIHVPRTVDIPKDYEGVMGVPITYLKYHNADEYAIVGEANHGSDNEFDLFKPKIGGRETFKRILIQKKKKLPTEYVILDLFCGAGGISYGMHKNSHFKTAVALDNDEKAALTFKRNMPETEVYVGDITDTEIKNEVIEKSKELGVNMIVGGPPCQGYALKGKKLGLEDPRNFLFREYLDFVKALQPAVFVIENVRTLLSTSKGWFKQEIISTIERLGYQVEVGVLRAIDFGVPQTRERAIFICCKNHRISLPEPKGKELVTVRQAISDLAYHESGEGSFEEEYITEPTSEYQMIMRSGSKKLYNHKASNHLPIAIEKLKMIPPEKGKEFLPKDMVGKQTFNSTWGRLVWDEPSPTIDTRFDAASNGKNNHPFLHRAITPREAARIQSFDDNFIFYGAKINIRKQIGNAVPPLMAKAIADQIYNESVKVNGRMEK